MFSAGPNKFYLNSFGQNPFSINLRTSLKFGSLSLSMEKISASRTMLISSMVLRLDHCTNYASFIDICISC